MNRRQLLSGLAAVAASAAGGLAGAEWSRTQVDQELAATGRINTDLRRAIEQVTRSAASGGGVNRHLMPDPVTGELTVAVEEVFTFNHEYAICRVDTNPKAFKMKTYQLGEVTIAPNQFFMAMLANTVDRFHIETLPTGPRKLTMEGGLSCTTEVAQATTTIGSRTVGEPADYRVVAIDGGPGGGKAGDSFAFTALFDSKSAPVNHAIFGPEATFTGTMVAGEITIIDPRTVLR